MPDVKVKNKVYEVVKPVVPWTPQQPSQVSTQMTSPFQWTLPKSNLQGSPLETRTREWWQFWEGETGKTFPEFFDELDLSGKYAAKEFVENPNVKTFVTMMEMSPAIGMTGNLGGKVPKIPRKGKIIPKPVEVIGKEPIKITQKVTPAPGVTKITPSVTPVKTPDEILNDFGKRIASPKTAEEFATQKEIWSIEGAKRDARFVELLQKEQAKGTSAEESIRRATSTLAGEYPRTLTGLGLPPEFKDAAYAKISKVILADDTIPMGVKGREIAGTTTALDNALLGKPIPNIPGIKGGSAKSRLLKIFHDNPIIKEIIDNPDAVQKRLLENMPPPEKLDTAILNYLRNVKNIPFGGARLGEVYIPPSVIKPVSKQATIDLMIDLAKAPTPVSQTPAEAIRRFRQFSLLPPSQRMKISDTLNKVGINVIDALGIPKALKFSYDVSYMFRQLGIAGVRHPIQWTKTWKPYIQAMKSDAIAFKLDDLIKTDPELVEAMSKMTPDFYDIQRGATYWGRPESMASKVAERYIPGVRMSNRGAAVALNHFLAGVTKDTYKIMQRMGAREEEYKAMSSLLNELVGRGEMPKVLQGNIGALLNALLSSPRYVASRFEWPTKILSESKIVRQEAASTLVAWTGLMTTISGMAYASGVRMELDPRSSDAYKLRIGNKRIDIWVGYAQIIRLFAQLATGQRKTETGVIVPITRAQVLGRYAQSKESPGIGALVTLTSGKNYVGEKTDFKTLEGIGKFMKETFAPASLEEMVDAYVLEGVPSSALSGIGLVGVGVSTYAPSGASSGMTPNITPGQRRNLR